jgi:nucleoside-diphosphate-sugar epimerase
MQKDSKIYVAGHNGMVGSAIVRKLKAEGHTNILTASSKEVNLINQAAVNEWFEANITGLCICSGSKSRRHQCQQRVSRRLFI